MVTYKWIIRDLATPTNVLSVQVCHPSGLQAFKESEPLRVQMKIMNSLVRKGKWETHLARLVLTLNRWVNSIRIQMTSK